MTAWRVLSLPDCLASIGKVSKIPKKKFLDAGQYPIVSQEKGIVNGYWDDENDVITVDRSLVVFGDHTQVLKHVNFDFVVGADGVRLLQPKSFLDSKYLYYFLMGNPLKTLGYARHYRLLKELDVRFPSPLEQKRIVAILDKAFEGIDKAIANTEKNLANARELFESYLNNVFTQRDRNEKLVTLADLTIDITDGDHAPPPKSPAGVPFITISNIDKATNKIDFSKTYFVSKSYFQSLKPKRRPMVGDVLYTVTGSFGIPVLVAEQKDFCFQRHIGLLRPKVGVVSAWLYYLLMSPLVFRQASAGATGTAQKTVGLKVLREIKVPEMLHSKQKEVVSALDSLFFDTQRLESVYQQKLNSLTELKQSLLQKAFSGELTASSGITDTTPQPKVRKKASDEFVEAVLISQFVRLMSDDRFALGRKRYNKLCYLAHRKNEDDVAGQYLKKAAGPYSPWAKYGGPEKIALNNGYIQPIKRGKYSGFIVGPSINKIDAYLENYPVYGAVDWVVQKLRYATTDDLELLTTVDFAAMEIVEQGERVNLHSVKSLIASNKEWAAKLKKSLFSDLGIQRALKQLAGLFPASFGANI